MTEPAWTFARFDAWVNTFDVDLSAFVEALLPAPNSGVEQEWGAYEHAKQQLVRTLQAPPRTGRARGGAQIERAMNALAARQEEPR